MILVISSPNSYAAKRLVKEAGIMNYELGIMGVEELVDNAFNVDLKDYKALYIRNPYVKGSAKYLPQIIKLAKKFKAAGKKVVDSNIASGNLGQGKWVDYQKLIKSRLPVPNTTNYELRIKKNGAADYPLILKWQYGMRGRDVFLAKNQKQLNTILPLHPKKEWLVQEFIQADYEYKVITVGYKTLPLVLRFEMKRHGFKLEYTKYKVIKSSQAHKIITIAEKAAKLLGRELAKIDILQRGNNFYILEVNRFPGLESFEELAKYNVTGDFLEYLQKP